MRKTLNIFVCLILFFPVFSQGTRYLKKRDSLFNELKKENHDTTAAKLNHLFAHYLAEDDYADSAFAYAFKAMAIAHSASFEKVIIKANQEIGYIYYDKEEIDSCHKYFGQALALIKEDRPEYYEILSGMGTVYFFKGDNIKSYEYYLRSLKVAEKTSNHIWISRAYGNVGVALKEQMKLDDALIFFNKALEISSKNDYKGMVYVALTNVGNVYSEKFEKTKSRYDAEKALENYFKAKELVMKMLNNDKQRSNAITLLGNIGNVYADLGEYTKARDMFLEALRMMGDKPFYGSKSMLYNNFATVYIELKNATEAEKYLKMARKEAVESGSPTDLMENYKSFSSFYETKKDFRNAYYAHWKYKKLSDSLFSTEVAEKRKEIELNAEFAQKESEAKALQDKKETLAQEEKKKQKIILYAFIVGFVLMIIVAFQFYRSYRIKQKSNEIITLQKAEVEKQKELVEMKQKEILDSIQYARRIQKAHLPTEEYMDKNLNRFKKG
jgi:tetratricopeptide (TPR) repeat protein